MQITFYITKETVENMLAPDYEALERARDGDLSLYRIRPTMCNFMIDEHGERIPYEQALRITEKFTVKMCTDFVKQFFEAMRDAALPKKNGNLSNLPSEVPTAASEFPPGSVT